jgi:hypothetical protein
MAHACNPSYSQEAEIRKIADFSASPGK